MLQHNFKTELPMKAVASLKCKEKLGLPLSLPEQKQSARQIDIVCSPPRASIPCVAPKRINQKKKRENETLALPRVIFWACESIFWFRADTRMDFILAQKLRRMLFGSMNPFSFFFFLTLAAQSVEAQPRVTAG